jgi:hypothetical protein
MFSFRRRDDTSDQSYVALSRVRLIENVTFDQDFSYDRFSKSMTDNAIKRQLNAQMRQDVLSLQKTIQLKKVNLLEEVNPLDEDLLVIELENASKDSIA